MANDPGMEDKVYPPMNRFGKLLRHAMLTFHGIEHHANPDNTAITFASPVDFMAVADQLGKIAGRDRVDFLPGEEELRFRPDPAMVAAFVRYCRQDPRPGETGVDLRVAGEVAAVLVGRLAATDANTVSHDLGTILPIQDILLELAARDAMVS